MVNKPSLSVIMPVYNAGPYLKDAIESVLSQSFRDFEFIIINDGSSDDSASIIASYKDPRIKLIAQSNQGLVASLNTGIAQAQADFIARMDGDDLSMKDRFKLQMTYLKAHPQTVLLGSWFTAIDEKGERLYTITTLTRNDDIHRRLFVGNGFGHGSTIFSRVKAQKVGGYRQAYWPCEDYDLWRRLASQGKIANLPISLYKHRINADGISVRQAEKQFELEGRISHEIIADSSPPPLAFRDYFAGARYYRRIGAAVRQEFIRHNLELLFALRGKGFVSFIAGLVALILLAPFYTLHKILQRVFLSPKGRVRI